MAGGIDLFDLENIEVPRVDGEKRELETVLDGGGIF